MPRGSQLIRRCGKIPKMNIVAVANALTKYVKEQKEADVDVTRLLDPEKYKNMNRQDRRYTPHVPTLAKKIQLLEILVEGTGHQDASCTLEDLRLIFSSLVDNTSMAFSFGSNQSVANFLSSKYLLMMQDIHFFAKDPQRWHGVSCKFDAGSVRIVDTLIRCINKDTIIEKGSLDACNIEPFDLGSVEALSSGTANPAPCLQTPSKRGDGVDSIDVTPPKKARLTSSAAFSLSDDDFCDCLGSSQPPNLDVSSTKVDVSLTKVDALRKQALGRQIGRLTDGW